MFTLTLVVMGMLFAMPAFAADIQITIDGRTIQTDAAPIVQSGRTMVPLRVISENLGGTVDWNKPCIDVLTANDYGFTLKVGETDIYFYKAGDDLARGDKLDVAPFIKNNRTFVPLRFIAETDRKSVG